MPCLFFACILISELHTSTLNSLCGPSTIGARQCLSFHWESSPRRWHWIVFGHYVSANPNWRRDVNEGYCHCDLFFVGAQRIIFCGQTSGLTRVLVVIARGQGTGNREQGWASDNTLIRCVRGTKVSPTERAATASVWQSESWTRGEFLKGG